jgi:hypothetical protein
VGTIADNLRAGFESDALNVPPIKTVPFENAVEAYESGTHGIHSVDVTL